MMRLNMHAIRRSSQMLRFSRRGCSSESAKSADVRGLSSADISFRMIKMVRAFRTRGHFAASLDPLSAGSNEQTWPGDLNIPALGLYLLTVTLFLVCITYSVFI